MSERKYLPADWMDEISPPMQADPVAFVSLEVRSRRWYLMPVNGTYDDADEWQHLRAPLKPGDIITFATIEDSGESTLTMHVDGMWSAVPPIPVEVNLIWIEGESEDCNTSVDSLIRDSALAPGECCDVRWLIDSEVRLRFAPDGGRPHFVPVEEAPHG